MLLLVIQEPQAPGKREELGTPKAGLRLGTVLLSKCVGFQNPLSAVAHAQRHASRPDEHGQEPGCCSEGHTPAQNGGHDGPCLRAGAWSHLPITLSLPGPSVRPVSLAWGVDLSERLAGGYEVTQGHGWKGP